MTEIICTHLGIDYSSKCRFCGEYVRVFHEINGHMVEVMFPPIDWANNVLFDSSGNSYVLNHKDCEEVK